MNELKESEVQEILRNYLCNAGWEIIREARGHEHGVDLVGRKDGKEWDIEVKGCGSLPAMRHNLFLSALGEILQRMDRPDVEYSIAFPDIKRFRNLWAQLPLEAKRRTKITALFVSEVGVVDHVLE